MKKNKFKVGDLVTLSAAGMRIQSNWDVSEGFGIVIAVDQLHQFPVTCHWPAKKHWHTGGKHVFKTYELKFHKAVKK